MLGGVCAGLAVHPGWAGAWLFRLAFLLGTFVAPFPTVPVYLLLWLQLPKDTQAPTGAPLPKVSWSMRRRLKRIGKQVAAVHRMHDPRIAALAQETFDAIKLLAPGLQKPRTVRDERLAEAALVRFPQLLDKMGAVPAQDLADSSAPTRRTPANVLRDRLVAMHDGFMQAATRDVEAATDGSGPPAEETGRELQSLHERLRPLAIRLGQSGATQAVATLESIEAKLEFLLGRIGTTQDGMDLRPFKVRRIAFEYLPTTLEHYLQLPSELAGRHRIGGERTAAQALQEQLELLDTRLADLTRSVYEKDATGLLVHGRFLREKFAEAGLRLDDPEPAPAAIPDPKTGTAREPERSMS